MREDDIGSARGLRRALAALSGTPLHPQWFAHRHRDARLAELAAEVRGRVLDVGCADQAPRRFLDPQCTYVGLDYYATASGWYGTRPHVYGNAAALPFADASFDWVLLLDVLEHLPNAEHALHEAARVLRPGGRLALQVPFLYPLHDAPLDFQRWTLPGLRELARRAGLSVAREEALSGPFEAAALLANLAASRSVLHWLRRGNPLLLLGAVLPLFVLGANLLGWALSRSVPHDGFMPHGFRILARK